MKQVNMILRVLVINFKTKKPMGKLTVDFSIYNNTVINLPLF